MNRFIATLAASSLLLAPVIVRAEPVHREIPFTLKTGLGVPRTYTFRFALVDAADPLVATVLWSEEKALAMTTKRLRHVLGSVDPVGNPLNPDIFDRQLWVRVERRKSGSWRGVGRPVLLAAAPYALRSESAGSLPPGVVTTTTIVDGAVTDAKVDPAIARDSEILPVVLAGDGAGSGVDADLLDGLHASGLAPAAHDHFGGLWMENSTTYGLNVSNNGGGDGIRAYSNANSSAYAALWAMNLNGSGTGVFGSSQDGIGVHAVSTNGDGLVATTTASGKSAVYGHSGNGFGATLRSDNNFGLQVGGGGDGSWSDLVGDLLLEGNRGELFAAGEILALYSNGYIVFDLDNDNNGFTQFEIWSGDEQLVFKVDENGNMTATGTKSAVVETATHGQRLMYAVESPEVWFEDFGTATLVDGSATVAFEPVFAETVNLVAGYRVLVTAVCADPVVLFVTGKAAGGFTVRGVGLDGGPSSCGFDYRVAAKRRGSEGVRLAVPDPSSASSRDAGPGK